MQFYIINKDPATSAKMLPTYALKVNMREGWQILSDIGHRFGVSFENQNKAYNPVHPWTRQFSHEQSFRNFVRHLEACCKEYYNRTGKLPCWCGWVAGFMVHGKIEDFLFELPANQENETIDYLCTSKASKMTEEELFNLRGF
jgi:hypothetical protein